MSSLLSDSSLASGTITLSFYDRTGNLLSPAQARAVMTNGDSGWDNDVLINPASLQNIVDQPLYDVGNNLAFSLTSNPVALAVNWPTTQGYSTVILDNGGAGFLTSATINFTYQAAKDAWRNLNNALTARPDYRASSNFTTAQSTAASYLRSAAAAANESYRGRFGQLALDNIDIAADLMLREYGPAFAKANLPTATPWFGTTFDTTSNLTRSLNNATAATAPYGWVRLVFDRGVAPYNYSSAVRAIKARGFKILGEPIDSSDAKSYTRSQYLRRFQSYVQAFPQIDAWEVGNEVNGSWLGSGMAGKISDVAAYLHTAAPNALKVLTLYWQMGTDYAQYSTFNWPRQNLPAGVRQNLDVILLSTYIEDAPMGLAFDRVMNQLHAEFPSQRIGLGELGYWSPDTSQAWWAFSKTDPTGAGRRAVAAQYYAAMLGYPFSVGGGFWWYFAEDPLADPSFASIISGVVAQVAR